MDPVQLRLANYAETDPDTNLPCQQVIEAMLPDRRREVWLVARNPHLEQCAMDVIW